MTIQLFNDQINGKKSEDYSQRVDELLVSEDSERYLSSDWLKQINENKKVSKHLSLS